MRDYLIAPSVLSADFAILGAEVETALHIQADRNLASQLRWSIQVQHLDASWNQ